LHQTSEVAPIVRDVLSGPGEPLSAAARKFLEPRFGYDFSKVRVHANARAAESARAVQAQAYTVGRHMVFGTGQYKPGDRSGNSTLAHEATHAVQQGFKDFDPSRPLEVGAPHDASEREADRNESAAGGTQLHANEAMGTWLIARKACLKGDLCKPPIKGANDSVAKESSDKSKKEAELKAAGQTTWEFSIYFRRFAEQANKDLIDIPTAWLVSKTSPWKAFAASCPADLDARDDIYQPAATGQRNAKGKADHCIFASAAREAEAKTFLEDPSAMTIGGMSRQDWEFESRLIINHEASHVPVRREVTEKLNRNAYPTEQHAEMEAGPLNEAAGVLGELPLIFDREYYHPSGIENERFARRAVRAKIQGPDPPGSSYTIAGLMQRACCMVPCQDAKARLETLVSRHARRWTVEQKSVIVPEISATDFCAGEVQLADPATLDPPPRIVPRRNYNPALGPGP
jgi:hypothetical protein